MAAQPVDLESITITTEALRAWRGACRSVVRALPGEIEPEEIPNEQAEVLADGRLRVSVPHPRLRRRVLAAMVLPPEHWTWRS